MHASCDLRRGPGKITECVVYSSHFVGLRKVDVVYLAGASRKKVYTYMYIIQALYTGARMYGYNVEYIRQVGLIYT